MLLELDYSELLLLLESEQQLQYKAEEVLRGLLTSVGSLEGFSEDSRGEVPSVGDMVLLSQGAPPEYHQHLAVVTKVMAPQCTVCSP